MAEKHGYRLMLTTAQGEMIDSWEMDDDLGRDTFYEFAAKMDTVDDFTLSEIRAQLATYNE